MQSTLLVLATAPPASSAVDWLALLAALGVGGILMKVLDALLFDRWAKRREFRIWIRDSRLRAITRLARLMKTLGFEEEGEPSVENFNAQEVGWKLRGAVTEAFLLTGDDELAMDLRKLDGRWSEYVRARRKGDSARELLRKYGKASNEFLDKCRKVITEDRM